jgi:hypothetical protein
MLGAVRWILAGAVVVTAAIAGGRALPAVHVNASYEVEITLSPESGQAPVGETHTVQALVEELQGTGELTIQFRIIDGPNEGLTSTQCIPTCVIIGTGGQSTTLSWTYRSNGVAGTDLIEACVEERESLEGVCSNEVTMTWVEVRRVGSFPAAIVPAAADSAERNRARAAAAAAPATAQAVTAPNTGTGITPPNTGDGGLLRR